MLSQLLLYFGWGDSKSISTPFAGHCDARGASVINYPERTWEFTGNRLVAKKATVLWKISSQNTISVTPLIKIVKISIFRFDQPRVKKNGSRFAISMRGGHSASKKRTSNFPPVVYGLQKASQPASLKSLHKTRHYSFRFSPETRSIIIL